jgi:hypothetical protein
MLLAQDLYHWPQICRIPGNVYEDATIGTRFVLHGIPAFIVFRGVRKVGRVTEWLRAQAFIWAIENQIPIAEGV